MISIYQLNRTVSLIKRISNKSIESDIPIIEEPIIPDKAETIVSHCIVPDTLKSPIKKIEESKKEDPLNIEPSKGREKIDSKSYMKCIKPKYSIIKTAYANHYVHHASDSRRTKLYPFPNHSGHPHQGCSAIPNIPHIPVPIIYNNKPIQAPIYRPLIPNPPHNPYIPEEPAYMPLKYYPYKAHPLYTTKRPRIVYTPKIHKVSYPPAMVVPPRTMQSDLTLLVHKNFKNNHTTIDTMNNLHRNHTINPMNHTQHNAERFIKHVPSNQILYNVYNQNHLKAYHTKN